MGKKQPVCPPKSDSHAGRDLEGRKEPNPRWLAGGSKKGFARAGKGRGGSRRRCPQYRTPWKSNAGPFVYAVRSV